MSGSAVIPVVVVTLLWLAVGAVAPCFVRGPNKSVIQTMLILTAVCGWLFWLCTYLTQLNPLIGPEVTPEIAINMVEQWGS